jgi:putative membrane protein
MNKLPHRLAAGCLLLTATLAFADSKAPNDAQIAGIVVTANTVDIDAGKLAETKAQDPKVKAFAQRMVTDHGGVNAQASALAQKLKLKPEASDVSKSLQQGGAANVSRLQGLQGAAFDSAYVEHEVVYHQAVLDAIDKTLIPNAKNAELKNLIVKVRPAIDDHLQHAKHLQDDLGKK